MNKLNKWERAKVLAKQYGVYESVIRGLKDVRTMKTGSHRQSAKFYCVEDVKLAMDKLFTRIV